MKEREVEKDWRLLFFRAGNSHEGVGSHGNSSLDVGARGRAASGSGDCKETSFWPRPRRTTEPWNSREPQTDTIVYSPVFSTSLITLLLHLFCPLHARRYVSSLGIQKQITSSVSWKTQYHLWHPWSPCGERIRVYMWRCLRLDFFCFWSFSHQKAMINNT